VLRPNPAEEVESRPPQRGLPVDTARRMLAALDLRA
jgi:hypothetical protein